MGSQTDWLKLSTMVYLCAFAQGSDKQRRDSLDSFVYDYSMKKLSNRPRTGTVYDISLPANSSMIHVLFVRLRARTLWRNGANYSSFEIPPYTMPWPFSRRVDIVYQNLGNLSSSYYHVPNHTFVTPVLGFLAYNPNTSYPNNGLIELKTMRDDHIVIWFPSVSSQKDHASCKCVRFDPNDTLELSDMIKGSGCIVSKQGHFSVVIPHKQEQEQDHVSKWKVLGIIVVGCVGLLLLVSFGIAAFRWIKLKRLKEMEEHSERSESLDSIWVGRSKMPTASNSRTQPVIENSYVP